MPMPPPVKISEPARMPAWAALLLTAGGLLGLLIVSRLAWSVTDPPRIASAEISPKQHATDFSVTAVSATYPAELLVMAQAITTALAPTPEPTATYAMLPTPRPLVCGRDSVSGDLCEWVVTPTATPGPEVCVTPVKGASCLWRGWPRVTDDT